MLVKVLIRSAPGPWGGENSVGEPCTPRTAAPGVYAGVQISWPLGGGQGRGECSGTIRGKGGIRPGLEVTVGSAA